MSPTDPKREFAVDVVRRLQEAGHRALWAGGCVRDFLLGRPPQDYDVATDARPDQVRDLFGHRRTHAVGASFGVILVRGPKGAGDVEVATFRTEGPYRDGRRPDHVTFSSPEEDARRRDFTINGVFYDPLKGQVHDFVHGERDLSAALVRAIGEPRDRMREDKLRMLRAVRFAATLEFELDPATADAVREMADEIHVVSPERIAQELRKMLVDRHRKRAMQLAHEVDLLPRIFPELAPILRSPAGSAPALAWERTLQMLHLLHEPIFGLAAAVLLHAAVDPHGTTPESTDSAAADAASPQETNAPAPVDSAARAERALALAETVGRRLRLSNLEIEQIGWLLAHEHDLDDAPRLPLARLKRLFAQTLSNELLALVRAETLARNAGLEPVVFCEEFLRNTPAAELNPPPLVTGADLIAAGLKPGRRFRELLEAARDAQLNGEIDSREGAMDLIRTLLKDRPH